MEFSKNIARFLRNLMFPIKFEANLSLFFLYYRKVDRLN
jgi:hypothetical protein